MSIPATATRPERRYWRVMLGKGSAHASECLEAGFIGVNFGIEEDLSGTFPEDWRDFNKEFVPRLITIDPERTKRSAGLAAAQVWTTGFGIREGDVILAPDGTGTYRVGVVSGPYRYQPESQLPHQRPVQWGKGIARDALSASLKNSLGSLLSVISIQDHFVNEIESLRSGNVPVIEVKGSDDAVEDPLSFAMELHLEHFLVANWAQTPLGTEYDILEIDGETVGQQFQTDTGPIDILALSKDGTTYAIIELKRGRASDAVVGQTLRYMGYVREAIAESEQKVLGIIIALQDDPKLKRALSEVSSVSFYRYRIDFTLEATE
jgi:restriction system protein